MRVLITGGTGFIGSRLALRYIEGGSSVCVFGQQNTDAEAANRAMIESKGAEVVIGSITDRQLLADVAEGADTVFHLAAAQHEMNVPDVHFREVNVGGTRTILEASISAGVSRFIHGSTIGVYGPASGRVDESSACRPDNIYGRTKLEGEEVARGYCDQLPLVIVRIPEVYGPGDRRLLKLFRTVKRGFFFTIGAGENCHHPLYVDDLIDALASLAVHPAAAGEVILLAGPEPVTTNEMVRAVASSVGSRAPTLRTPLAPWLAVATILEVTFRPLGLQPPLHRRRLDFFRKGFSIITDRARDLIGFSPAVSFEEGARRTATWYEREGWL